MALRLGDVRRAVHVRAGTGTTNHSHNIPFELKYSVFSGKTNHLEEHKFSCAGSHRPLTEPLFCLLSWSLMQCHLLMCVLYLMQSWICFWYFLALQSTRAQMKLPPESRTPGFGRWICYPIHPTGPGSRALQPISDLFSFHHIPVVHTCSQCLLSVSTLLYTFLPQVPLGEQDILEARLHSPGQHVS